jgi:tRNA A-37 threonylcarbamoyl transferase component Bud32
MSPDVRVSALLERWRLSVESGQPSATEELCRDCPELRPELERLIALEQRQAREPSLPTTVETLLLPVPLPTSTLLPQVPDYEVLEELGHGGMGVVYKARHLHLNRVVALKMIRAGALAAPEQRLRFLAEAKAAASIEHPGIVRVFDFGTFHGQPFFASELCPGGSLAQVLQGRPLTPQRAAALVERIAEAVEAAHQRGIVHRDLKPTNILLDAEEQPKIADFGLAKHMEGSSDLTPSGAIMGTRSYMAPEQAQARKDVGPAADVWALGAILYECLTGRPPFKAATDYDTIMQVVCDEPVRVRTLNPEVPRDLEAVCLKCLEKDPRQRYTSARELAEELRRFLQGESVQVRPAAPHRRALRWLKKCAPAAAAVAGIVLALVAGLHLGSGRPPVPPQGNGVVPIDDGQRSARQPKPVEEDAVVRQVRRLLAEQWQAEIAALAQQVVAVLGEQKQAQVAVNEITGWRIDALGRRGPSPVSPLLQQALVRELRKRKAYSERADWFLTGESPVEESPEELRLFLEIALRDPKGKKVFEFPLKLTLALQPAAAQARRPAEEDEVRRMPPPPRKVPPRRAGQLEPLLKKKLQPAAARLAQEIADWMAEEKLKDLAFAEFTGPPGPTSAGSRIKEALIAEVKKRGVVVSDDAGWFVKGEYLLVEGAAGQGKDEVIVRLELTLRNRKRSYIHLPIVEISSRDP